MGHSAFRLPPYLAACLVLCAGLPVFAASGQPQPSDQPLAVQRITPVGASVEPSRQIVIEFNRQVVPLGRMERTTAEIPITITPTLVCQWRWITTRTLACNLDEKQQMQRATEYKLEIKPGIRSLDGNTLAEPVSHSFITRRPQVQGVNFKRWIDPATPVIRLYWDQAVARGSVGDHLYFSTKAGKRIPALVVEDTEKRLLPDWLRLPGEKTAVKTAAEPERGDDQAKTIKGESYRRIWLVRPAKALPEDETVSLTVEPGLKPALGSMPSVEQRIVRRFDTFPALSVIGVACRTNENQPVLITSAKPQSPTSLCNPLGGVSLRFSAPVARRAVKENVVFTPAFSKPGAAADPWGDDDEEDDTVTFPHRQAMTYDVYLPWGLAAAQTYSFTIRGRDVAWWERVWDWVMFVLGRTSAANDTLQDKFGRGFSAPLTLSFATGHRPPNFLLEYSTAVLEKAIDSDVPVYVNNIESLTWDYNLLTAGGARKNQTRTVPVPKVPDIQFAMPMGVRTMLDGQSGALWAALGTTPGINQRYVNRAVFAEVTPFQVHAKLGHFNTLVWVTDLVTGQPVPGVDVSVYKDRLGRLDGPGAAPDAAARTGADGLALLPGTETLDPKLEYRYVYEADKPQLFVRAVKGKDMALLPLGQPFEINNYRASGTSFYPVSQRKFGHMAVWGTTAQGIYHPGDKVQYKIYVRNQDNVGFVPPPREGYVLKVTDPAGKVILERKDVGLSVFGALDGAIDINKKAAVGWYNIDLSARLNGEDRHWTAVRVLVSDFTPSPFAVTNGLDGDLFHPGDTAHVRSAAKLHSGGPYLNAQVRVTALLSPKPFTARREDLKRFVFGSGASGSYAPPQGTQVFETTGALDDKGEFEAAVPLNDKSVFSGRLMVETAVQDDRGKYIAHQAYADYVGVDRLVGLRIPKWFYTTADDVIPDFIVTDDHGVPVAGVPVVMKLERKERKGARVKGSGNAYLTDADFTVVTEDQCKATSKAEIATCAMKARRAGDYTLRATVTDTHGRTQETVTQLWVSGRDYVMWGRENDNYLELIPDKDTYVIGDTAHFVVKNAFPGAQALVTVERNGVMDSFVTTLKDSAAIVDVPVKPDAVPGFYVSVAVMSPRVDKPVDSSQVDLGKPAYRLGYVRVPVRDPYKEIIVTAQAAQAVYRPGDTVRVKLNARPRQSKNEPVELAVAVLDDAVFDLIAQGRQYYDPYAGFYNFGPLDLRNYSLLSGLVGRQKFEKKGANPGGDGGSSLDMRAVFKYVSYWNPSLETDADGNAEIEFAVPDNLTGWHILAMAATPTDRFGLGEGSFKVNRPTEVRPEMPNQVTEGDTFSARFTVMNRTQNTRTLQVRIAATGTVEPVAAAPQTLTLKPFERATVSQVVKAAAVKAARDSEQGVIRFEVTAGDAGDRDGLVHTLPVNKRRALDVAASYGTTTDDKVTEAIAVPADIYPDVGALSVDVAASVIGNLEGAFKYLRDYPYSCWEQVMTRGVMASHFARLKGYLAEQISWPGHERLPEDALASAAEYQAPNGGMAYFVASDDHADPYLSAYTGRAFTWLKRSGHAVPDEVEKKLDDYLLAFLRRDAAPSFYSEGMTSTVRAVALAALAENHKATGADLERYAPAAKDMSLFGKTHFALAALNIPGEEKYALDTAKLILNAANETSGKLVFNEEVDDSYARILHSPMRENCAILELFSALSQTPAGRTLAGDVPFKLVRTVTQGRGNRDHWENTQENVFCTAALAAYAQAFERDKPDLKVTASLDGAGFGEAAFTGLRAPVTTFTRPLAAADAGRAASVAITRAGTGRLYYTARISYASRGAAAEDVNAGIEVHREYSVQRDGKWTLLAAPYALRRGELARVDLYVTLPAARNFVVVDDPVPGGLEPVNGTLATASKVDAAKGAFEAAAGSLWFKYSDWSGYNFSFWSFNHQELRNDAARFYADYLPAGRYHLSYTAQAIGTGDFTIMPTLAAEMYDPDVYGKTTFVPLKIGEK